MRWAALLLDLFKWKFGCCALCPLHASDTYYCHFDTYAFVSDVGRSHWSDDGRHEERRCQSGWRGLLLSRCVSSHDSLTTVLVGRYDPLLYESI